MTTPVYCDICDKRARQFRLQILPGEVIIVCRACAERGEEEAGAATAGAGGQAQ